MPSLEGEKDHCQEDKEQGCGLWYRANRTASVAAPVLRGYAQCERVQGIDEQPGAIRGHPVQQIQVGDLDELRRKEFSGVG